MHLPMNDHLTAIILAAGQGTRMKSRRAKVLHPLCGRRMIDWVVTAALAGGARDVIVVVGRDRDEVTAHLATAFGDAVRTAVQAEQRGTGDAVRAALPALGTRVTSVLVLYGDTPLVRAETLRSLCALRAARHCRLGMLTCLADDPHGYGRILRNQDGAVVGVREDRDASTAERAVREVNPGMYCSTVEFLARTIAGLRADNAQGELYLTDIVAAAAGDVAALEADAGELVGVNDRAQLAAVEDALHARIARGWANAGATIRTGARIDANVVLGADCTIEPGVVLRGRTRVASGARIDVGCVLEDTDVGERAWLKPYSVATGARIGADARIGPFAHLRPKTDVGDEAHVGNFVETKATRLARGAKANHLAYLGDGDIGEGANIGAGTIFCNYDGFAKNPTVIGARAFVGSDSQLVAPVTVGEGAYVATGTTVTKDVPPDALAIGRLPQENKLGYASRLRSRLASRAKSAAAGASTPPASTTEELVAANLDASDPGVPASPHPKH